MNGLCPLTTEQIIDEYFIENRTRLLEVAAYLGRLQRSADGRSAAEDFRMQAFNRALEVLASKTPGQIDQIQLILSDPTVEPRAKLDQKSASGAWRPATSTALESK